MMVFFLENVKSHNNFTPVHLGQVWRNYGEQWRKDLCAFFSKMNMYSSTKGSVQDNHEYQEFLKMLTGKTKTRETGNNNYSFQSKVSYKQCINEISIYISNISHSNIKFENHMLYSKQILLKLYNHWYILINIFKDSIVNKCIWFRKAPFNLEKRFWGEGKVTYCTNLLTARLL